jgi:hypothetical protein
MLMAHVRRARVDNVDVAYADVCQLLPDVRTPATRADYDGTKSLQHGVRIRTQKRLPLRTRTH